VAQGVGPELKPQYCKKKKRKERKKKRRKEKGKLHTGEKNISK
jgi:hypothetical protein